MIDPNKAERRFFEDANVLLFPIRLFRWVWRAVGYISLAIIVTPFMVYFFTTHTIHNRDAMVAWVSTKPAITLDFRHPIKTCPAPTGELNWDQNLLMGTRDWDWGTVEEWTSGKSAANFLALRQACLFSKNMEEANPHFYLPDAPVVTVQVLKEMPDAGAWSDFEEELSRFENRATKEDVFSVPGPFVVGLCVGEDCKSGATTLENDFIGDVLLHHEPVPTPKQARAIAALQLFSGHSPEESAQTSPTPPRVSSTTLWFGAAIVLFILGWVFVHTIGNRKDAESEALETRDEPDLDMSEDACDEGDEEDGVENEVTNRYREMGRGFARFVNRDDWVQFITPKRRLPFSISELAGNTLLMDIAAIICSMDNSLLGNVFNGVLLWEIFQKIPGFDDMTVFSAKEFLQNIWDDVHPHLGADGLWRPVSLEAVAVLDTKTGGKEACALSFLFEELVAAVRSGKSLDSASLASTVGAYRRMLHNYASTASKEGDFADSEQASSGTAHSAENPDKDYQLLGVQPNCSAEELKAAYRNAVSQWHPDHLQQMAPELRQFATERLAKINAAYSRLSKSQAVGACDSE